MLKIVAGNRLVSYLSQCPQNDAHAPPFSWLELACRYFQASSIKIEVDSLLPGILLVLAVFSFVPSVGEPLLKCVWPLPASSFLPAFGLVITHGLGQGLWNS